jgi:hypothetical protein
MNFKCGNEVIKMTRIDTEKDNARNVLKKLFEKMAFDSSVILNCSDSEHPFNGSGIEDYIEVKKLKMGENDNPIFVCEFSAIINNIDGKRDVMCWAVKGQSLVEISNSYYNDVIDQFLFVNEYKFLFLDEK